MPNNRAYLSDQSGLGPERYCCFHLAGSAAAYELVVP